MQRDGALLRGEYAVQRRDLRVGDPGDGVLHGDLHEPHPERLDDGPLVPVELRETAGGDDGREALVLELLERGRRRLGAEDDVARLAAVLKARNVACDGVGDGEALAAAGGEHEGDG